MQTGLLRHDDALFGRMMSKHIDVMDMDSMVKWVNNELFLNNEI